jgi:DNA end-binding protein Ku
MPRAIWSGAISFGLVNVPVKLFSATSPKNVRFNQLNAKTGARIRQKRVDASTGEEVPYEDIVKGYELAPERYVLIEPEELDALDPKVTHTIDVEAFVNLAEIDPIFYDSTYYLAPATGGARPYRLLLEALAAENKVAIAKVVLRSKQQLCALRALTGAGDHNPSAVLTLTTMLWGDEVNSPEDLDGLDAAEPASAKELKMARQLIGMQAADFDPKDYKDEYRERVLQLIEQKANGSAR